MRPLRPRRDGTSEDAKDLALLPALPLNHGSSIRDAHPPQSNKSYATTKPRTAEETIDLTRRAVEDGLQETQRSLAGNEAVDDVVRPKLTIDLGYSNIDLIPESVVDIIKSEVERLDYPIFIIDCSYRSATGYCLCRYWRNTHADFPADYPSRITISIIFLPDSQNAVIYVTSTFEQTISLCFRKQYVHESGSGIHFIHEC